MKRVVLILTTLAAIVVSLTAAAGGFTDANWSAVGGGVGTGFYSERNPYVCVARDNSGNIYAGGGFTNAGSISASHVAKWNGNEWSSLGSGVSSASPPQSALVTCLACDHWGNLYAGGTFLRAGDVNATNIAKWDGTNWSALGAELTFPAPNAGPEAVACDNIGNVYAAGTGLSIGATTLGIAKWNGTNWSSLGSATSRGISALAVDPMGNLYAGGLFTNMGDVAAMDVAKWDGSNWSALGPGLGIVQCLVCDDVGNLYAGQQTSPNSDFIAKWDGAQWSGLGFGQNGVFALACDDLGNLYAGGVFAANNVAQWNGTTWSALGSGTSGGVTVVSASIFQDAPEVLSMVCDPSGNLYVGGLFTMAGTNKALQIAEALLSPSCYGLALGSDGKTNTITGFATPGFSYALDLATNLTAPINWIPQATNTPVYPSFIFTNISGSGQGYYRTRYVPQ